MMLRDGGYIYNVWSVFTYPLTRGLPAYKAQTCSEFTAGILRIAGLRLDRPDCRYHPEDFTHLLEGLEAVSDTHLQTAEADIVSPAVAAEDPDALLSQEFLILQDSLAVRAVRMLLELSNQSLGSSLVGSTCLLYTSS